MTRLKAILLMGPTATGKTELALKLAQKFPLEIISVDSALIYRDMDIGSAKPSSAELLQVPHHLIDILDPTQSYCVARFIQDATTLIKEVNQRGHIPMLVGGTMMYYNALINGISELPQANPDLRKALEASALKSGWEVLHEQLSQVDPISSIKIMPNDKQRITRALEVYTLSGIPMSQLQQQNKSQPLLNINYLPLAILPNRREILHERINARLVKMLENGFVDEVKVLQQKYPNLTINHTSMRSVGYYQVWQYLNGEINQDELLAQAQAATRQLAKRQITWLRSMNIINFAENDFSLDNLFVNLVKQVVSWR